MVWAISVAAERRSIVVAPRDALVEIFGRVTLLAMVIVRMPWRASCFRDPGTGRVRR
jgi:hypothetical protein